MGFMVDYHPSSACMFLRPNPVLFLFPHVAQPLSVFFAYCEFTRRGGDISIGRCMCLTLLCIRFSIAPWFYTILVVSAFGRQRSLFSSSSCACCVSSTKNHPQPTHYITAITAEDPETGEYKPIKDSKNDAAAGSYQAPAPTTHEE